MRSPRNTMAVIYSVPSLEKWGEWQRRVRKEVRVECGYGKSSTKSIIDNLMMVRGRGEPDNRIEEWSIELVNVHAWVLEQEEEDRNILILYYVDMIDVQPIARRLGISRRRTYKRLAYLQGIWHVGKG